MFPSLTRSFLALLSVVVFARAEVVIPEEYKTGGFALGCQAYCFNRFTAYEAIEKTAAAGGRVIEFYPGQVLSKEDPTLKVHHNSGDDVISKLQAKLLEYKLLAVNYGVVALPNDEQECRKVFQFAKKLGLRGVTSEPSPQAMGLIEKLCIEYDLTMGIHNHPRRPNNPDYKFWDPHYELSLVKDRDRRLGSCADTGHFVRSGIKPTEALKILEGRVVSSHLKDLHEFAPGGHDVPFGTGKSDIPGILDELKRQKFSGHISVEYEYNIEHSVPEIAQCIGFVRGYTSPR